MSTKLTYPRLPAGYEWNLAYRLQINTGYWPNISHTSNQTVVTFAEDLSQGAIDLVDAVMAVPATAQEPIKFEMTGNTYIVKDIWEHRATLEADAGFNIAVSYRRSASPPDPAAQDEIVLQPTDPTYKAIKILTNPEKNDLVAAVNSLGYWE